MLSAVFLLHYFVIAAFGSEDTKDGDTLENVYVYKCGSVTLIYNCDLEYESGESCSNVAVIESLLTKAKIESHFNLPNDTVKRCSREKVNSNRGMTFSEEGVPLTPPDNSQSEFLLVLTKATIYKWKNPNYKFVNKGCIFFVDQGTHAFFVPFNKVTPTLVSTRKPVDGANVCYDYMMMNKLKSDVIYENKHPIILVPGYFASEMVARLNNVTAVPHDGCLEYTKTYDYKLWVSYKSMGTFPAVECWVHYMSLHFNKTTRRTENTPGSEARVDNWGTVKSIKRFGPLVPLIPMFDDYFKAFVDVAEKWGYNDGVEIRGAPYDFRKAPNEAEAYFSRLKLLVEETYEINELRKVVFLAHSMGNLYTLYFLNHMSQEWKDKYIKSFVAVAAPWYGSVSAVNIFINGEAADIPTFMVEPMSVRPAQRTFPSSVFLLPSRKMFTNEVLAVLNDKVYTTQNYEEFFEDVGFLDGYEIWKETHGLIEELESPGVEVHCLIAFGIDTAERYEYYNITSMDDWNKTREITYGPGDGLVNLRSGMGCMKWKETLNDKFHSAYFQSKHKEILASKQFIDYVRSVVSGKIPNKFINTV